MVRVGCGLQVMNNSRAGELKVFAFLFAPELFRSLAVVAVVPLGCLAGFHLCFHVFAFPSSRHAYSLTHFEAGAGVYEKESSKRQLGTGSAAAGQDGERSVHLHDAAESSLGDVGEMLGENALVGKFSGIV
jgi:hypothetical protein